MVINTEDSFGVCRTCLEPIPRQPDLGAGASDCRRKLSTCFPELNVALTSNLALCNFCTDAVDSSLKFKTLCYQTEVRILKYLQQAGPNITTADLAQIAKANRNESAVVDLHIKEENVEIKQESGDYCMDNTLEGNRIQQNINNELALTDDGEEKVTMNKCYHKENSSKVYVYRCHKCPYTSTYKLQFDTHIRTHLTKSGYRILRSNIQRKKGKKCNKTQKQTKITLSPFNGRNHLKPHRQMHRKENPMICNQKHVENHKLKHAGEKDFQCDRRSTKCSLKSNMEIRIRGKPFSCNHCDFSTKYRGNLKNHMVIHTTEKLKCQHCDFSTKHKYSLKNHMIIHTSVKLKCQHCDYSTKHKQTLKRHMDIHTSVKLKCQHCDYSTTRKENLKRHMVIHTLVKLKCHSCDFSTKHKYCLKSHMVIHTTEEFKCYHCDFSTKHKRNVKRHMIIHTTKKCTT